MSYYLELNGKSFDKKILETAENLSKTRYRKRLTKTDVKEIANHALDGGKVTSIEEDSLSHVLLNHQFTEEALIWFTNQFDHFGCSFQKINL